MEDISPLPQYTKIGPSLSLFSLFFVLSIYFSPLTSISPPLIIFSPFSFTFCSFPLLTSNIISDQPTVFNIYTPWGKCMKREKRNKMSKYVWESKYLNPEHHCYQVSKLKEICLLSEHYCKYQLPMAITFWLSFGPQIGPVLRSRNYLFRLRLSYSFWACSSAENGLRLQLQPVTVKITFSFTNHVHFGKIYIDLIMYFLLPCRFLKSHMIGLQVVHLLCSGGK